METLIAYLPLLACGAVMVVCFRMMSEGHGMPQHATAEYELADLKESSAGSRTDRLGPRGDTTWLSERREQR